ncbi:MAG: precorrin-8X methylmutase [Clostridia bacterium]|nr:precorrin-8X methylmutase [Clostridia bacterium]
MKPLEIERRSFEIIKEELGNRPMDPEYDLLIRRVIHATADFEYYDTLTFSPHAMHVLTDAIASGADIVTDTTMAAAGINKTALKTFGGEVHCFIADPDVAKEAKARSMTRSQVSMEKAATMEKPLIFAIGNAPTALFSICDLVNAGKLHPKMVIGVPVGFVNVVEAKEALMQLPVPYIVARGRKGGSSVAAAIVNAALYQLVTREE